MKNQNDIDKNLDAINDVKRIFNKQIGEYNKIGKEVHRQAKKERLEEIKKRFKNE